MEKNPAASGAFVYETMSKGTSYNPPHTHTQKERGGGQAV